MVATIDGENESLPVRYEVVFPKLLADDAFESQNQSLVKRMVDKRWGGASIIIENQDGNVVLERINISNFPGNAAPPHDLATHLETMKQQGLQRIEAWQQKEAGEGRYIRVYFALYAMVGTPYVRMGEELRQEVMHKMPTVELNGALFELSSTLKSHYVRSKMPSMGYAAYSRAAQQPVPDVEQQKGPASAPAA